MRPGHTGVTHVIVSYATKKAGVRKEKEFTDPVKARSFYIAQNKRGNHPTIRCYTK